MMRRAAKAEIHHCCTLQRPFKATGGADLRTSQVHAHRCFGAPTVTGNAKPTFLIMYTNG